ncbi:type II secretion system F family protein [Fusobacterium sp. PH5-44]|uniref:type II secretion system F family protein n=1 Tax=unclassified Fusobacterium TaxID=2648384 RepID=UPI003D257607
MGSYRYIAYNKKGNKINGIIKADSIANAKLSLKKNKLILIDISESSKNASSFIYDFVFKKKIQKEKLLQYFHEMKIMLESGIGIVESLKIQEEETKDLQLKKIIGEIRKEITKGNTIWEAFNNYEDTFSPLYINFIKVGELSGTLSENFARIEENLKMEIDIRKKIKEASFYPTVILSFSLIVVIFLIKYVLPNFISMFEDSSVKLPLITIIFLTIGNHIGKGLALFMAIIGGLIYSMKKLLLRKKYRYRYHKYSLNIPFCGNIIKKKLITTISKNFSLLLNSGMGIIESIENITNNINNSYIETNFIRVKENILSGSNISDSIKLLELYPNNYLKMILIGEETGKIVEIFDKIAEISHSDMENIIKNLLVVIEPMLILLLGIIIGLVIVAIYLPIFSISELVI